MSDVNRRSEDNSTSGVVAEDAPGRSSDDLEFVYDLWVDFMTMRNDGTLLAYADDLRDGLRVNVGDVVTVGSEDARPARAKVIRVDADGTVVVRVIGPPETHSAKSDGEQTVSDAPELPVLAADLTFARAKGGRVYSGLADWDDESRRPAIGEHVMVADGSTGPIEAVIEEVRGDGTIVLSVLEFAGRQPRPPFKSVRGLWKGVDISEEDIDEVRREMNPVLANVMGLDVPADGADQVLAAVLALKGYELVGEPGLIDTGSEEPDVAVVFDNGSGPKTAVAGVVFGHLREEHVAAFVDRTATELWRNAMGSAGYGPPWIPYIYSTGGAIAPAMAVLKAAGPGFLRPHGEVVVPRITILEDGTVTMDVGAGENEDWGPIVDVTEVRVLARYFLELTFETGEVRVIDVEPMLWGPAFELILADYSYFQQVRVDPECGTIVWPGGEDLSPRTLYAESKLAVPVLRQAEGRVDRGEGVPN